MQMSLSSYPLTKKHDHFLSCFWFIAVAQKYFPGKSTWWLGNHEVFEVTLSQTNYCHQKKNPNKTPNKQTTLPRAKLHSVEPLYQFCVSNLLQPEYPWPWSGSQTSRHCMTAKTLPLHTGLLLMQQHVTYILGPIALCFHSCRPNG